MGASGTEEDTVRNTPSPPFTISSSSPLAPNAVMRSGSRTGPLAMGASAAAEAGPGSAGASSTSSSTWSNCSGSRPDAAAARARRGVTEASRRTTPLRRGVTLTRLTLALQVHAEVVAQFPVAEDHLAGDLPGEEVDVVEEVHLGLPLDHQAVGVLVHEHVGAGQVRGGARLVQVRRDVRRHVVDLVPDPPVVDLAPPAVAGVVAPVQGVGPLLQAQLVVLLGRAHHQHAPVPGDVGVVQELDAVAQVLVGE